MNAYELADYIDKEVWGGAIIPQITTMLRQQADRIAELEKALNWIATVNAMDYEYQDVAKAVLKQEEINVL